MDNFLEKFSVFDFFNLIITGFVFIISLQFLGIDLHSYIIEKCLIDIFSNVDDKISGNLIFYIVVMIVISYIIGSCIQEIGSFIQNKKFRFKEKAIRKFLNNKNVIGNETKRLIYINEAKKLFKDKGIKLNGNKFTKAQCSYFFTHCLYYIQVRGYHGKTERMREIYGLSNMLSTCFAILSLIGCVNIIYLLMNDFEYCHNLILIIVFSVLAVVFWFRMKRDNLNRIRMIMGIYEACIGMD